MIERTTLQIFWLSVNNSVSWHLLKRLNYCKIHCQRLDTTSPRLNMVTLPPMLPSFTTCPLYCLSPLLLAIRIDFCYFVPFHDFLCILFYLHISSPNEELFNFQDFDLLHIWRSPDNVSTRYDHDRQQIQGAVQDPWIRKSAGAYQGWHP